MRKINLLIITNVSIFCTLVITAEILGQAMYYLKTEQFISETVPDPVSTFFEVHPYLAGRPKSNVTIQEEGRKISSTNRNTRWTGAPEDESHLVRVAVLGGSTTFGTRVSDRDSWPALLQTKLGNRFSVTNFGVPGYSTAEAIIQMAFLVPERKPHFVIFYQGWNDIRNYHDAGLGADYYGHGLSQYYSLGIPTFNEKTALEKLYDASAIVKLASKIRTTFFQPPASHADQIFEVPDPFVDRIYVRNLKTLKLLAEPISSYTFFVPQLLNNSMFEGKEDSRLWSPHIKDSAMPKLMDRFNSLMNSICLPDESHCLFIDGVLQERWEAEDFFDDGHFSRRGGKKFVEILSRAILVKTKEADLYRHASEKNDTTAFLLQSKAEGEFRHYAN